MGQSFVDAVSGPSAVGNIAIDAISDANNTALGFTDADAILKAARDAANSAQKQADPLRC